MIIVRYADDFIIGFQYRADAERFQRELEERLRHFELELHPEKTRLIEFGRFAEKNQDWRGGPRPPTFKLLGFTHYCGKNKKGGFTVKRHSSSKRMRRTLVDISKELRRRWRMTVPEQGAWLRRVVQGWLQYHAVPHNYAALSRFHQEVGQRWLKALESGAFVAHAGICAGGARNGRPYRDSAASARTRRTAFRRSLERSRRSLANPSCRSGRRPRRRPSGRRSSPA
ncbi:MAG: reverse transcriptase domain-containing protein [Deltaproteobacteria bacterium]